MPLCPLSDSPFLSLHFRHDRAWRAVESFHQKRQRIHFLDWICQSTQIKIAEASAKIDAARLIMRSACVNAMEDARRGRIPDMAIKTRYRRDGAFSVNLCTDAVSMLFAASGARGLFTTGVLQRQFRDAHAINSHLAFNFDAAGTNYGRVALGLPSENLTL